MASQLIIFRITQVHECTTFKRFAVLHLNLHIRYPLLLLMTWAQCDWNSESCLSQTFSTANLGIIWVFIC